MITDFLTVPENPITYVIDSGARGKLGPDYAAGRHERTRSKPVRAHHRASDPE